MKQSVEENRVKWGWIVLVGMIITGLWISPASIMGYSFIIDQSNDAFSPLLYQSIQHLSPIGQEFTPTFSPLQVVELFTTDLDIDNGIGAVLLVNIHPWTITNPIIGTSSSVTLPDNFVGVTHFDFPSSVPLIPGNLYVIEAVVVSGNNWGIGSSGGPSSTYPGGRQILQGVPQPDNDLWFREGPIPELSTLLLLGSGLGILSMLRRKRAVKKV
ncbi:MAG TPA: hypothetical protein EYP78_02420 [Candidatus Omnitrophica bacterium]|nr:hypothetical protein [Candidatus Omnitrophota bacterium]